MYVQRYRYKLLCMLQNLYLSEHLSSDCVFLLGLSFLRGHVIAAEMSQNATTF